MEWAVELKGVSKAFLIKRNAALSLKVRLLGLFDPRHRERPEEFWALHGVDVAVRAGESLGLIGPNGSGKSTLLRLVAGIFRPTRGEVVVRGRVTPMIELGAGFHPDLTGRENIYLNASLYSLSRRETDLLYQEIVDFSELETFIDVPVKNYSTGMYMRLAFSVAVHLDPDVLLVDEILAVGDERFRGKCLDRMEGFRRQGKTIILVSHDMETISRMTDRACLLVRGAVEAEGEPLKVIERYREVLGVSGAPRAGRGRRRAVPAPEDASGG